MSKMNDLHIPFAISSKPQWARYTTRLMPSDIFFSCQFAKWEICCSHFFYLCVFAGRGCFCKCNYILADKSISRTFENWSFARWDSDCFDRNGKRKIICAEKGASGEWRPRMETESIILIKYSQCNGFYIARLIPKIFFFSSETGKIVGW